MTQSQFSRRAFLQSTAAAAGASLVPGSILLDSQPSFALQASSANDRIRFGIVGVGMEGSNVLGTAVALPGTECVAAADLYDGRHTLAREIVGKPIKTTRRYQELLDDKSIDAILVAVPDHWHKQVVVDALAAGKDVYCEKPMSHTPADGLEMVAAAKKTDRIVQIGAQRTSSVLCAKVKELIASGAIGDLNLIEATMGRNDPTGAWEYPPPPDLSPENLDWNTWLGTAPKKPFDPYTFARWRCWREYGTGVAGDLLVHLISGMMFSLGINEVPASASAFGGIYRWKDGRNMPDVHAVMFEYMGIPVYMRLSLDCEMAEVTRFQGSKGLIELREFSVTHSPQAGVDLSPSYYDGSFPRKCAKRTARNGTRSTIPSREKNRIRPRPLGTATITTTCVPMFGSSLRPCARRQPVVQDAVFGHHAALACHLANESYFRKSPVYWDDSSQSIKIIGLSAKEQRT